MSATHRNKYQFSQGPGSPCIRSKYWPWATTSAQIGPYSPAANMVGTALSKTSKEAGLGLVWQCQFESTYIVHTSPSSCFHALESSSHMYQCRLNFFTCRHYRPGPSSTRKDTFGRPVARFDVNYFHNSIFQGCYNDGVFKRLSQTLLQHFASKNLLDQNFHIINYTIRLLW